MSNDPIQMAIDALEVVGLSWELHARTLEDDDGSITDMVNEALTALRQHQQDGGWSDEWKDAPRDGSSVELLRKDGRISVLYWSTSYSVFGLGGCWTDGLCTMGDKIDFTHWRKHMLPAPKKENDDER